MTRSVTEAVAALGTWVSGLRWDAVPAPVAERLGTVLFDVLAANAVGARTEGQRAWRAAWPAPPGHSPVVGGGTLTDPVTAAWLNGPATVCLELDEGNKYAKGHPAAHVFPAVLALAAELDVAGEELAAALLAGYEVAARFGEATSLRSGTHPHGNWGVAGAAAGCARLLGLDAERTAAAIDAGSGLPVAGHFDSALDGNPVRDTWLGAANASGIAAARLAVAGSARNTGTAARTLGELLGSFDPEKLGEGLGSRFLISGNYFKRHSSCSYTHPVADLLIDARAHVDVAEVTEIEVHTHALAAGLDRTTWHNQLSAMFSTPFVAAVALLHGEVAPRYTELAPQEAPEIADLAKRVRVIEDPELTKRLPANRAARITVRLADGRSHTAEAANPVGDTDFQPLDRDRLGVVFAGLLDGDQAVLRAVGAVVDGMPAAPGARALLAPLAG
ncbi:MmgE/PrpD family protein [Amycolatopsis acidicola]|uniref:MmgE/PrpD family protein n=1 Tax=Amycolatopsis acidicola TaxID=2596893 RepID=A0A5N0V983_9PSEU|nr:MmgE/PrpD family protein [Amycolatopsis acidicola]KAA9161610.1 MmgE/PrpD family protein [Amycolatopsis acidicola]